MPENERTQMHLSPSCFEMKLQKYSFSTMPILFVCFAKMKLLVPLPEKIVSRMEQMCLRNTAKMFASTMVRKNNKHLMVLVLFKHIFK